SVGEPGKSSTCDSKYFSPSSSFSLPRLIQRSISGGNGAETAPIDGTARSVYRSTGGPVGTARTGRYTSKR
ncbi:hypothetical protein BHM03_00040987, partial [Ensete ventricosum]